MQEAGMGTSEVTSEEVGEAPEGVAVKVVLTGSNYYRGGTEAG